MYAAACMPLRLSITAYVRVSNGGVARSHGVLFYLMCTHSRAQTSPQGMGHAVSLSFHRFKGRPYKRWMSFKKKNEPVDGYESGPAIHHFYII